MIMNISLELVPSKLDTLVVQLEKAKENFPEIEIINIPDLLRHEIRSWEGCKVAKESFNRVIPHIRAIDINPDMPLPMGEFLAKNNINEVLVLKGDLPQSIQQKIYDTSTTEVIRKFKSEYPKIKVYGAIDPYRSSLKSEKLYIEKKIRAGADGFFTQPFFDRRLLSLYEDILDGIDAYYGLSPVLSEGSQNYWYTKNNVIFPRSFTPDMNWNIRFAKEMLERAEAKNKNIYFMPIRTNIVQYLTNVFR